MWLWHSVKPTSWKHSQFTTIQFSLNGQTNGCCRFSASFFSFLWYFLGYGDGVRSDAQFASVFLFGCWEYRSTNETHARNGVSEVECT